MLGLLAAQLKLKVAKHGREPKNLVWVDVSHFRDVDDDEKLIQKTK
jgi:hypothetical protein